MRWDLTQQELAQELGIDPIQVSQLENGIATGLSDAKVDALFKRLDLDDATGHAAFIKWLGRNYRDL